MWDKERLIQKRAHLEEAGGKDAEARYRVLERFEFQSLIEVSLETGKRNQIRVQAGARGYPLVGERQYRFGRVSRGGAGACVPEAGAARRAALVRAPVARTNGQFTAALPEDMAELVRALRGGR